MTLACREYAGKDYLGFHSALLKNKMLNDKNTVLG